MREKKMTRDIKKSNNQLALILKTSKVKIWIYDVSGRTITSLDNDGSQKAICHRQSTSNRQSPMTLTV